MIRNEELLEYLVCYGRSSVQDYVIRSSNIQDAIDYIRLERGLEVLRSTSHSTKDLVTFEKRERRGGWSFDALPLPVQQGTMNTSQIDKEEGSD